MNSSKQNQEIAETLAAVAAAPANKVTFSKWENWKDNGQPGGMKKVFLDGEEIGWIEKHYDNGNFMHSSLTPSSWFIVEYEWNPNEGRGESFDVDVAKDESAPAAFKRFKAKIIESLNLETPRQIIGTDVYGVPVLTPRVGDGATKCIGSDSYAGTIVKVSANGKKITWQRDTDTPNAEHEGPYGHQSYDYEPNPEAQTMEFSLRQHGNFKVVGDSGRGGYGLILNERRTYRDPSF